MERQLTMMTAGPSFTVELPSDGPWMMEASSPIDITGDGWGREFVFVEDANDDPPAPENEVLVETVTTPYGLETEIYQRIEKPDQWTLRWRLEGGVLYSHLREEDGIEYASTVVKSVEPVGNGTGMPPTLLLNPPLARMVRLQPGYHEYVLLHDPGHDIWIHVRRPSTLKNTQIRTVPRFEGDERPLVFRGADGGLEIIVSSAGQSSDMIADVARSIRLTTDA